MDNIVIAGKKITTEKVPDEVKNKLWLSLWVEYELFIIGWGQKKLILIINKHNNHATPSQSKSISLRIEKTLGMDAVFYYDRMPTYERDRLVDKDVYFVVGNKFAYVPGLIANRRMSEQDFAEILSPAAQYMLLYHLQVNSLDGLSIQDMIELLPYKYATVAKSIQQLCALGLADFSQSENKLKRIVLNPDKRQLWETALPYLINPIKQVGYVDNELSIGKIGGIEALSHYSMLAGEDSPTRVLTSDKSKQIEISLSKFEDMQRIEIWKYPPISNNEYVDKLSLYLTLKDDNDPRVEKELETMINQMSW